MIEMPVPDPRVKLCSVLSFKDRRGKTWFKDMHTQKVINGWKVRRRIEAIKRAKLKGLAQQYSPPPQCWPMMQRDQAMSGRVRHRDTWDSPATNANRQPGKF